MHTLSLQRLAGANDEATHVQVYIDDVPVWGFIGKVEKVDHGVRNVHTQYSYFLFTHFHFEISYNEDRIVSIDCAADAQSARNITQPHAQEITFTYSAQWTPTTKKVLPLGPRSC